MKYINLWMLYLLGMSLSQAQVLREDISKINKTYEQYEELAFNVSYALYDQHVGGELVQLEKGYFHKSGDLLKNKISAFTTIQNDDYSLIIDDEEKNIIISEIYTKKPRGKQEMHLVQLDTLLKLCTEVNSTPIDDQQFLHSMKLKSNEFSQVDITYDRQQYLINKIVIYYKGEKKVFGEEDTPISQPRVEIIYTDFDGKPDFPKDAFTYQPFLTQKAGQLSCNADYKNYEFIDLYSKNSSK